MDGYDIAILIGAVTLIFGTLALVAHYLTTNILTKLKANLYF
ncbi:hypothetical protein [Campylobacter volucris]|nr:hypothetical protein [Campylobacter volucris]